MREQLERFAADEDALRRTYRVPGSPQRLDRLERFYRRWLATLDSGAARDEAPGEEDWVDALLLRLTVVTRLHDLAREREEQAEAGPLVAFAGAIYELADQRRRRELPPAEAVARNVAALAREIRAATRRLEGEGAKSIIRRLATGIVEQLSEALSEWFRYYYGYDPLFTWWVTEPYHEVEEALKEYLNALQGGGTGSDAPIVGRPIGAEALAAGLADAVIAYDPEELLDIARQELEWCEREMVRASRDLGCKDDWHAALEQVKTLYVPPGEQPALIDRLAAEGVEFAEAHDLVTIPALAKETWRTAMMSPERQRINPFFLGGEVIRISYPTDTMTYDERMMSMRGNNPYFSRSTVFHELLPGHYLQQYMTARYKPYRRLYSNPFWIEGMAFYWEMRYWELGFNQTPEQRIGMLFWRMHRCARVMYTLGFHLGRMTPDDCVAFLVERVGHELDNARGEVRRLFEGGYGPLYQCAYLIGALQFRALHRELVADGPLSERAFHDAALQQGRLPLEILRAVLKGERLTPDHRPSWRFYEAIAPLERD